MSPYMSVNGLHEGQEDETEFNVALNDFDKKLIVPIFDEFSSLEWELLTEPIIQYSPDNLVLDTGFIHFWDEFPNSHYMFEMADEIYWNPSFNITERDSSSSPLVTETSPGIWEVTDQSILMEGLKSGEKSNGSNLKVTAKDVVFTLLTAANPLTSGNADDYKWLVDCYVDPTEPRWFHIFVDDNPETTNIEHFDDVLSFLNQGLLPEFFLNSTDTTISYTSGGIKCVGLNQTTRSTSQWVTYGNSPFGCGKYMLDYHDENPVSILTRSPFWYGRGAIDGEFGKTPFVETIKLFDYPNDEERIRIVKSGKLDLISTTKQVIKHPLDLRFEVQVMIQNSMTLMAFNLGREFIGGSSNNIWIEGPDGNNYTEACAVRKAICYAIDREELNQAVHNGEYTITNSPIFPYTASFYREDSSDYDRVIASAWRWFDSTRRYKVGINTTRTTFPVTAICISMVLIIRSINKNKRFLVKSNFEE
jgi:hypothetical protein